MDEQSKAVAEAKAGIRAIYDNEIGCSEEYTWATHGVTFFRRNIVLAGLNTKVGKTSHCELTYAIFADGDWCQAACSYGAWEG